MGIDVSNLMAESLIFKYFVFGGFLPLLLFSLFWLVFPKRFVRRLQGESNEKVKAERPIQLTILPTMILVVLMIFGYGAMWLMYDINVLIVVALNFMYLFTSAFSMKFVVGKLDEFNTKLNSARSVKHEETMYLTKEYKGSILQYTPILVLVSLILIPILVGALPTIVEIAILIVVYGLIYYIQNIALPNYLTFNYVYYVLPPTKEESIQQFKEYKEKYNKGNIGKDKVETIKEESEERD